MAPDERPGGPGPPSPPPPPPPRRHTGHAGASARGRRPPTPFARNQMYDLRMLVGYLMEEDRLAREEEEYERLFLRGEEGGGGGGDDDGGQSPPCLRCALAGMHCSAARAPPHGDEVRCRRCERSGERFCIRQTGPGVELLLLLPGGPEAPGGVPGAVGRPGVRGEDLVGGGGGGGVLEPGSTLYCLDPALWGDRCRLLDVAADMLHRDGAKSVHGTRVSPVHARNFALPMWHENDDPGNRGNPDYVMRTPVAYFREVEAKRKKKWAKMEMKRIKQEKAEAQSVQRKKNRAERLGVIMEQRARGKTSEQTYLRR